MTSEVDVVIVGAGAAGIAAARRLAASPLSSLVLEASSHVGGRAWTHDIAGLPLDLGCEWLHSGDRNPWTQIAGQAGFDVNQRLPAWDSQYGDLGFSAEDQAAAQAAFNAWARRLQDALPPSDCAADALEPGGPWNAYIRANLGYISGAAPERISAADYTAYDRASKGINWRVPRGYGALVASAFPSAAILSLATPLEAFSLTPFGVTLKTPRGDLRARCVILTVSTAVLANETIALPRELDPWRAAASRLPLGRNEKLFFEIVGASPFEPESHVFGGPHDPATGSFLIRPHGWPIIECFLGANGAEIIEREGPASAFARAKDELAALFGTEILKALRPLLATDWSRASRIGGAYSCALPGHSAARGELARPYDGRIFLAGEATHPFDFSTAHGAYETGLRAADEAIAALSKVLA